MRLNPIFICGVGLSVGCGNIEAGPQCGAGTVAHDGQCVLASSGGTGGLASGAGGRNTGGVIGATGGTDAGPTHVSVCPTSPLASTDLLMLENFESGSVSTWFSWDGCKLALGRDDLLLVKPGDWHEDALVRHVRYRTERFTLTGGDCRRERGQKSP